MNIDSLCYKPCDICGRSVSIGRDVCDKCCKSFGTHISYIRAYDSTNDILKTLKRIRSEAERSYKRESQSEHLS